MPDPKQYKRVVIVGAGVAGLSSAYLIKKYCDENDIKISITIMSLER
jgi:protoporphyrinogen oxidase